VEDLAAIVKRPEYDIGVLTPSNANAFPPLAEQVRSAFDLDEAGFNSRSRVGVTERIVQSVR